MTGGPLRPARWSELAEVYRLHRTVFPHPYGFWRFIGYQVSPRSTILVVPGDRGLRAYGVATISDLWHPPGVVGEIISLAVLEPYRRQGLARLLMADLVGFLETRGMGEIYLQVAVSNTPAQELYNDLGFTVKDRLPRYYVDGEDAWLMVRVSSEEA
ncbi:MAG: GNAT family N-acetyltransferase [Armatimonadetes bacterium]|nr:GNAT family N-acetyltransferase [Armatimonadota bacterium]